MPPALLLAALTSGAAPTTDVRVPPGFVAELYADHAAANDVYTMTTDDAGRVVVAGRGYVRALDGNRAIDLLDGLKDGPMGLLAEGDSLFVVADGGLKRYRGYNGRDKLTNPETILAAKTAGEHDAHAVRRGPDGWLYLLCGNMAGVGRSKVTSPRSPVRDPVAGSLVRISPDFKDVEVVADGFRNAYSFDFHTSGEPFTYDSDNERCVGLPWYEPCRFYHVVPGGNYGWRSPQLSQTWRKPPYFPDVVPPVCTLGRGSPTGVACYRHTHFPAEYRGGFFLADWTFGRIHFVPLTPNGATWTGTPRVFAEANGENGFAPTALAVHPKTGELFVSIGGRGTRGGVYRIRHAGSPAGEVLPAAKRSLEWDAAAVQDATSDNPLSRRRGLELMLRHGRRDPAAVRANLGHADPLVRAAAGRLAAAMTVPIDALTRPQERLTLALARVGTAPDPSLDAALLVLADPLAAADLRVQALRVVQLACGDLTAPSANGTVWEGYTFRTAVPEPRAEEIRQALQRQVLSNDRRVVREATRTLAALGPRKGDLPGILWPAFVPETTAADDFHTLIVCARLKMGEGIADQLAAGLLDIERKVEAEQLTRDRHWPLRLEEAVAGLGGAAALGKAVTASPEFGKPHTVAFVRPLRIDPSAAARAVLRVSSADAKYAWTPGIVALLKHLPPAESRPLLLRAWDRGGLDDAVLPVLAAAPEPADAAKFVAGLRSFDADVVRVSALALTKLPAPDGQADVVAAVLSLRRLPDDKAAKPARDAVVALLERRADHKAGTDAKAWAGWFEKSHPALAAKLQTSGGYDAAAWKKRQAAIPWDDGDAAAGKAVFAKASCAACHDGARAVGPSLLGVAKRFGRDDLLTSVVDPNRDVPPRYRPTRVVTTDGKAFVGMIVYEAVDGVILQTGADTTVRVAGENIESKRTVDTSLMPAGLLDKLTDREVADLMAYLRTLGDGK
jgi:putative heme-binding domain-containing protein